MKPRWVSEGSASYQSVEPGPRHREDGAHRHLDRPSVQRVRAPWGEQDGVDAERRRTANHRPHVRVVDDVLQDHDRPGPVGEPRRGWAALRRWSDASAPRWTWKPGHLLGESLADDETGRFGSTRGRRRAPRAIVRPSGRSGARSPPRPLAEPPSPPLRGTDRDRTRPSCGVRRREGPGSRPGGGLPRRRPGPASPSGHTSVARRCHVADDDDRGRPDGLVRDGRRDLPQRRSEHPLGRHRAVAHDGDGSVAPLARSRASPRRWRPMLSTAISRTTVPPVPATADQSTSDAG